jgi:hypothetical protein
MFGPPALADRYLDRRPAGLNSAYRSKCSADDGLVHEVAKQRPVVPALR